MLPNEDDDDVSTKNNLSPELAARVSADFVWPLIPWADQISHKGTI